MTTTETETETDPRIDAETGEVFHDEVEDSPAAESSVDYERIKKWVIQQSGKDFIQYAGLLDLLHQVSQGDFTITTKLEQAPTKENGETAIVSAIACIGTNDRCASGLGDANPGNVSRAMAPHTIRMAETRAKGRALRDLLNIPLVTVEELGPRGNEAAQPRMGPPAGDYDRAAPRPTQSTPAPVNTDGLTVEGQWYSRDQIWGFFQQRRTQMRERNLSFPSPALQRTSPLPQIVEQTRQMRMAIAADIAKAKPA